MKDWLLSWMPKKCLFSTELPSFFAAFQKCLVKDKFLDPDLSDNRSTTADDFISLIDSVGSIDGPREPLSWEGPVQR